MRMWRIVSVPAFRRYWFGDIGSGLMAEVLQVAVMWHLTAFGHAPQGVGWFGFFSAAPVVIGGPLVAHLFRRWSVRSVMVLELLIRMLGSGFLAALLLTATGHAVPFWAFDLVAGLGALFLMASSAGGPSLWPQLLPERQIGHAMQAEQFEWNLVSAIGPLVAGWLIAGVGLAAIAAVAALLFALCSVNLATIPLTGQGRQVVLERARADGAMVREVWRAIARERAIWLTTGLFWVLNAVGGLESVFLPLIVRAFWHGDAWLYGALLGTGAIGGLVGSLTLASAQSGHLLRKGDVMGIPRERSDAASAAWPARSGVRLRRPRHLFRDRRRDRHLGAEAALRRDRRGGTSGRAVLHPHRAMDGIAVRRPPGGPRLAASHGGRRACGRRRADVARRAGRVGRRRRLAATDRGFAAVCRARRMTTLCGAAP